MNQTTIENSIVEVEFDNQKPVQNEEAVAELSACQLALVGGGSGVVCF